MGRRKTFALYALVKKVTVKWASHCTTRAARSTVVSRASCCRVVILLLVMVLVVKAFTVQSLQMKILNVSTTNHFYYLWPTLVQEQTDLNFLLRRWKRRIWMASMLCLVVLLKVLIW